MAKLSLKLEKQSLYQPVANAAVVAIRQIADAQGAFPKAPFETSVPIPAGPVDPAVFDVPAGRYTLTARLPSGVAEHRTIEVGATPSDPVIFDPGRSEHEWLSWQTLSGSVPTQADYAKRGEKWRRSEPRRPRLGRMSLESDVPSPAFAVTLAPGLIAPASFTNAVLELADGRLSFQGVSAEPNRDLIVSFQRDPMAQSWQVQARPPEGRAAFGENPRAMAVVTAADSLSIALLPLPWGPANLTTAPPFAGPPSLVSIDVLYDHAAPPERAVRLVLQEPEFLALLSYLGAGRLGQATYALAGGTLDDHVTRLLAGKVDNPMAAAGAAYVGLATSGDEDKRRLWSPWLRNMMDWFPELPDGAILYGRDRLERCQSAADLEDAKAAFKTAFNRGVPHYVAGLQSLLNGLQVFSDPEASDLFDPEAKTMWDAVSVVTGLADPTQPFTVLTMPREP